jgi:glyoxylate reductase
MKPKVFVSRPLPAPALELLAQHFELEVRQHDSPMSPAQLAEACRNVDGLLIVGSRVTEEVLFAAPRLRAVSTPSVGYDNIDVAACTARHILVTNTVGVLEDTTADLAFALLLAVARRVIEGDRYVRESKWREWQFWLLHGADVHHKTLALYGFGRIGQALAARARGFSMPIIYYARHRAAEAVEREFEARYVDRETLLRQADFLSLHVPLTGETQHLIGDREFRLMKPSAFLINTARGKVVDEAAMVRALELGTIAGAGLDVFEEEPKVHPSLVAMPNVVLMPHVGSATSETRLKMAMLASENLIAVLDGRRPRDLVNPEAFG